MLLGSLPEVRARRVSLKNFELVEKTASRKREKEGAKKRKPLRENVERVKGMVGIE